MAFRQPANRLPNTVNFTLLEIAFLNSIKPWNKTKWSGDCGSPKINALRQAVKDEIKRQLLVIQDNYCAFCGLNLSLAYEIHREHIAPQYKQPQYIFEPGNLVLTCNFCNMNKKTTKTVTTNTGTYATEEFNILHPHRDNFNTYLSCDFLNNELIFKILGPELEKTKKTIKCYGLDAPHLLSQRGAIILKSAMPTSPALDWFVKLSIRFNRKRN